MLSKYTFNAVSHLFSDVKEYKVYENLEKIKELLNNQITSIKCIDIGINNSSRADAFYGLIVFPLFERNRISGEMEIKSYVIEIQKQLVDLLSPNELTAYLFHDISHNVLTMTVLERLKMAIHKACKMTDMKMVDIFYNMDNHIRDLIVLDISNRTYKDPIMPYTDMYEPDRLIDDLEVHEYYNSAIEKTANLDVDDSSNPENQNISDTYIASKVIKMVREKLKGIQRTYNELRNYISMMYDTKVFEMYPSINISVSEEVFGERISSIETLKPYDLQMLHEGVINAITKKQDSCAASLLESFFKEKRPSVSSLQKELDILSFKMETVGSNYERLAILDRIYDNIFSLERYLDKNPDDETISSYLKKFINLTSILKDVKISKRRYGVFVEVPPGYEG